MKCKQLTGMSIEQHELLNKAVRLLDQHEERPQRYYWFSPDGYDQDENYCYDCLMAINPDAKPGEDYLSGGSESEQDSPVTCEHCGRLLEYVLTDYGVTEELEHFVETGFVWDSPTECYELARVAHGMTDEDPRCKDLLEILMNGQNLPSELA